MLDLLHDELKLIRDEKEEAKSNQGGDWNMISEKAKGTMNFNNQSSKIDESLIRDIFGGVLRTELHVEGSRQTSVTFEPFFILNLEISKCYDLESCLCSFFDERRLSDYKVEGKERKAYYQQTFEKLP
jgi:ubiquitin C-terminal hydrolase